MTRREALALLLVSACGGRVAPSAANPSAPALSLSPAVDLVPAAGLVWLVDARLRELFTSSVLMTAIATILPEERLDAFAKRHGGVDLRQATELAIAGYPETVLAVADAVLDPVRIESAFAARAVGVDGRAVDGPVTRTWGTVGSTREQIAIFGREAVALEQGRFGPLRAAEYFARGKLRRALPALKAEPLARAATLLGDAPLRAFAPGPFEGAWARGLGGLLAGATAAAAAATPIDAPRPGLDLRFVVTGAWGTDAPAAADRLRAAFEVLAGDSLGRLLGLDRPLVAASSSGDAEALRLQVSLDAGRLAQGLHAATGATITEIMAL
ncbi:MAG TPA: hypothetical protein VIF09_00245 [Polyangiaceae bacterium]